MILRRLATSIRKQDWFTVVIETLIVVFGVFIGLQVNNWNAARVDRLAETQLLEQLRSEVLVAINLKTQWLDEIGSHRLALLEAIEVIQTNPEQSTISDAQCRAMWSSHLIYYPDARLSALDDLLAKGQMQTPVGRSVRPVLLRYRDQQEVIRQFNASLLSFANLGDTYADAFPRRIIADADVAVRPGIGTGEQAARLTDASFVTSCAPDLIRADRTIQNKLLSNLARTDGVMQRVGIQLSILQQIDSALSADTQ
jgi:hypothetical protein